MSYEIFLHRSSSDLKIQHYPIVEISNSQLAQIDTQLEAYETINATLKRFFAIVGCPSHHLNVQRVLSSEHAIKAMRQACLQKKPLIDFVEKNTLFVATDQNKRIQGVSHAIFHLEMQKVQLLNVVSAPWNFSNTFNLGQTQQYKSGVGSFLVEKTIGYMHHAYPDSGIYLETLPTAISFFQKKFNFQIQEQKGKLTVMTLSKNKAAAIAAKFLH